MRKYSSNNYAFHVPVMHKEVLEMFQPQQNQKFLDLTFGAGGHTRKLLSSARNITVYTLDRDPLAYELAIQLASETTNGQVVPLLGKFSDLPQLLSDPETCNFFDGILVDCGCSSMQFDTRERGFSLSKNGPLDMRMDQNRLENQPSAKDILANIDEDSLARVLKVYGEEKQAKKIARAIIEARYLFKSLQTTHELAQLIESTCGLSTRTDKLQRPSHVATKTFQALRILVNDELNELEFAVRYAHRALKIGGKLVTITFHSLEDR
jgi:receptor-type tyrosine-protein phosphatase gamma